MDNTAIHHKAATNPVFRIAGLTAAIAGAEILEELGRDYLAEEGAQTDISFDATEEALRLAQKNPDVPWDKCAFIASARRFYAHLLSFGGFAVHASAVVLDGKAYLFSADSGTGKSTHAALWCEHFGKERAYILNDDKPIIRKIDGRYYAYGAPWCGSSGINVNRCAQVQGIAFIEQSTVDWIEPMLPGHALIQLLRQSDPMVRREATDNLLTLFGLFIGQVPIFRMGCTIGDSAVLMAHGTMSKNAGEANCTQTA